MAESPQGQQCLFCLEEATSENTLVEIMFQQYYPPPTCTCRITTHTGCYIQYSMYKGRSECPICHRIYVSEEPIATATAVPPPPQEYIIIENRLYQHQPSLPIVTPEEPHIVCMHPSRAIRFTFLCSMIIMCAIVLFFRR
jgi:hypothetical protein